jgi:anaerobic magnesium-protoporphyrin IX monomethyl ester cyclase
MSRYKNVILVKPPEKSLVNFGGFSLGVLAAAVRDAADITIIDATRLSMVQAVEKVLSHEPDLLGITLMGLPSVRSGVTFIRALKETVSPPFPIIVGGHGASMTPEPLLEAGAHGVVFGEGENTFREILEKGLKPGMTGTIVWENNQVVRGAAPGLISPLDRLNPPARDLMPAPPDGIHLMETSRGCPHRCKFCETTRFYGLRWRPYSPKRVVQETLRLLDEYNGWLIHIADDNFTASTRRVKDICKELIREEALPAYFMFSARADDLVSDPDLLPLMAEARMLRITVGIDTLDAVVGKTVAKIIAPETYRKAFERMRELGMFSIASIIVGLPGETLEARERAVELAVEAGPDSAQFLPYLPLPGLPRDERHTGYEPHPDDIRDAHEFTNAFFRHATVQERLKAMAKKETLQGQMAIGTLRKAQRREEKGPSFHY